MSDVRQAAECVKSLRWLATGQCFDADDARREMLQAAEIIDRLTAERDAAVGTLTDVCKYVNRYVKKADSWNSDEDRQKMVKSIATAIAAREGAALPPPPAGSEQKAR